MNWLEAVDNYCERIDAAFWAEPLNAVSNLSFIVAALVLLRRWSAGRPGGTPALLLALNVLAIGFGSFLFHTFANRWSSLADVIPISVFIHAFFLLALRRFMGLAWWQAALAALALFIVSPFAARALASLAGSSAFYVPALLAIFGVGLASSRQHPHIARSLYATGAVFTVSILFRAADQPLCASLPAGTHLFWHMLNGLVLYRLVRLYMDVSAAPARR